MFLCLLKKNLFLRSEDQVNEDTTFIIDGESLAIAFNTCSELFCTVLMKAGRVVCCRLAPLQKAQVNPTLCNHDLMFMISVKY